MKTFEALSLDVATLKFNLSELETWLAIGGHLAERKHISPFFKARPQLCAALGLLTNAVEVPDRWANELDLFGDFTCDIAVGDSGANAYGLIEFEDAKANSIFCPLPKGKTMKRWSPRFEHGFSQLVDWAWRLSTEGETSDAFGRIFGRDNPTIHLLLIIGRDAGMTDDDHKRLRWRANHTSLGRFRISCFTFDGVLHSIRRKISLASVAASPL